VTRDIEPESLLATLALVHLEREELGGRWGRCRTSDRASLVKRDDARSSRERSRAIAELRRSPDVRAHLAAAGAGPASVPSIEICALTRSAAPSLVLSPRIDHNPIGIATMISNSHLALAFAPRRPVIDDSASEPSSAVPHTRTIATCLLLALAAGCLFPGRSAFADEGIAGFSHLSLTATPPAPDSVPQDSWQPVPTSKISLINLAPVLIPYFNDGPAFGLPGTVTGDFWNRTQLTGDWGGTRTELARHGLFFDLYSTSTYQDVTSGGLKTGSSFVQNTQISFNLDTGRAGLWSGGLLHLSVQSRYGSPPEDTFTGGATVPLYTGDVLPAPLNSSRVLPSEFFLVQGLSKRFSVVLGKISDIFIPDQTLMGDSYKYYFANFNFNKNPMTTNFYDPTALAALGVWVASPKFALAGGVLDPNSEPNNFASDAFNKVNLYLMAVASYDVGGLPGQFSPAFNWSNKPKANLESPYGQLSFAQIPQAVGGLVGGPTEGLPIDYKQDSWFAIANFSQYLYVKDGAAEIPEKMRSGQVLRGIGVFGRVGYAPPETNTVSRDASIAMFAHGLADARPYDSFGIGLYYNEISRNLKDELKLFTAGTLSVGDEKGMEAFYDFAITPAIRLIGSYQHIWDPLTASVATRQSKTDMVSTRLTVAF
jgi:porin